MAADVRSIFLDILTESSFPDHDPYLTRRLPFETLPKKAIVFTGVRRCGKTTFLREIRDRLVKQGVPPNSIVYCNFSDERLIGLHGSQLGELLEAHYERSSSEEGTPLHLFLDEIQVVDRWELFVDRVVRGGRHRVYLSGSSAKLLSREIASAMRGRSISHEIFPFNFKEYLEWTNQPTRPRGAAARAKIRAALKDYLTWGGFPEIARAGMDARRKILREYADVLLFRDIIERNDFSHPQIAKYLFTTLLSQAACAITINKTYDRLRSMGYRIEKAAVSEFLEWSEECYALFPVTIRSPSASKRATNPKKIYCVDNGLATLAGSAFSKNTGRLLENAVFVALRRKHPEIHYFRTKHGYEVDFVFHDSDGDLVLLQSCESLKDENTRAREIRALVDGMKELKGAKARLISLDEEETIQEGGVTIDVIPAWKFLLNP